MANRAELLMRSPRRDRTPQTVIDSLGARLPPAAARPQGAGPEALEGDELAFRSPLGAQGERTPSAVVASLGKRMPSAQSTDASTSIFSPAPVTASLEARRASAVRPEGPQTEKEKEKEKEKETATEGYAETLLLAVQHVAAACATSMVAVPVILGSAFGLSTGEVASLVSASYFASGLSTVLQTLHLQVPLGGGRSPLVVGSGLLCVMGTSAAFLGPLLALGAVRGGGSDAMAAALGTAMVATLLEALLCRFPEVLQRVFPPVVRGCVLLVLGLDLIKVGGKYWGGGIAALNAPDGGDFGSPTALGLGALVLAVILLVERLGSQRLRHFGVVLGLAVSFAVAGAMGEVDTEGIADASWIEAPRPLRWGLAVEWPFVFPLAVVVGVTTLESMADVTATCLAADLPTSGPEFEARLQGGLMGDALGSLLSAFLTAFPNTTYSQNVGIVGSSGVASRRVAKYAGALLLLFGLLGKVGAVMAAIPPAVMGGALTYLFANIAVSGLGILHALPLTRTNRVVIATMLGVGLAVSFVPELVLRSLWPGPEDDEGAEGVRIGVLQALSIPYSLAAMVGAPVHWFLSRGASSSSVAVAVAVEP